MAQAMSAQSRVTFCVAANVAREDGETVHVLGSSVALGDFLEDRSVPLHTSDATFPLWTTELPVVVTRGFPIEYRCVDGWGDVCLQRWGGNRQEAGLHELPWWCFTRRSTRRDGHPRCAAAVTLLRSVVAVWYRASGAVEEGVCDDTPTVCGHALVSYFDPVVAPFKLTR